MDKKSIILIVIILVLAFAVTLVAKLIISNDIEKNQATLTATVLENSGTSIMVKPDEGEDELKSSDKIVVRVPKDSAVMEDLSQFTVGSKVKITYNGEIMESYPAQINASKIELAE
ncbi:MAG: hypothetical protein K0R07_1432 [Sedimentibacter sp.]|jgi:ABC-type enterochelin transport system substrate-binding protein|nr:hypothetical protein [Sedimentibacter sp.]